MHAHTREQRNMNVFQSATQRKSKSTNPNTEPVRISAGSFFPASFCCVRSNLMPLICGEFLRSCCATLQATSATFGGMPLRFAHRVLSFADGNVEYLFGKLCGIAWTFAHRASMPRETHDLENPQELTLSCDIQPCPPREISRTSSRRRRYPQILQQRP